MQALSRVVPLLIVVNVLALAAVYLMPEFEQTAYETFALYFPKNSNFKYWQFVTNMFMHGGFMHLFFNMYALWAFGSPLESVWGKKRFTVFYFLSGIGASVVYIAVNYYRFDLIFNELLAQGMSADDIQTMLTTRAYDPQKLADYPKEKLQEIYSLFNVPAVGASGAIYGILVAFAFLFPEARLGLLFLPILIPAKYFVPALILLDLFSGITGFSIFGGGFGGNIAHFAHVGGALIGFLLMLAWRNNRGRTEFYQ